MAAPSVDETVLNGQHDYGKLTVQNARSCAAL